MESNGSTIWACAPILIIAVMETTRVPLAGWTAHLKPLAMVSGFIIMGAISVLTFEGMSMGVERFIHQRVMDVIAARDVLDAAKRKAHDADALVAKQATEVDKRRDNRRQAARRTTDCARQRAPGDVPWRLQGQAGHLCLPEQGQ